MGEGRPSVVLEAGRNDVAASWQAVMPLLAPHVHVVAYDRAGLGGSLPARDPAIVACQVSDLASLITEVAAGPCVLVGHSWGGILVQLLAFREPGLVAGLVLVDPAHEQMTSALPRVARWGLRLARAGRADELRGGDTAATAALLRELRSAPQPFSTCPSSCSAPPAASPAGSARTGPTFKNSWPRPPRKAAISSLTAPATTSPGNGPPSWPTRSCRWSPRPGQVMIRQAVREMAHNAREQSAAGFGMEGSACERMGLSHASAAR
jgi:pimeloyl-ACP methyl ester carboxylesterase